MRGTYRHELPDIAGKGNSHVHLHLQSKRSDRIRLSGPVSTACPHLPKICYRVSVPGNPVGYVRTTQRGKWVNVQFKRYQEYQQKLRAAIFDAYTDDPYISWMFAKHGRPFASSYNQPFEAQVSMYFANRQHPDPDNVAKAVNDALFYGDKYVSGSYTFAYSADNPRIEVAIAALSKQWITRP